MQVTTGGSGINGILVRESVSNTELGLLVDGGATDMGIIGTLSTDELHIRTDNSDRLVFDSGGTLATFSTTYIVLPTLGSTPPAADCDDAAEHGRMMWRTDTDALYICGGASGWRSL